MLAFRRGFLGVTRRILSLMAVGGLVASAFNVRTSSSIRLDNQTESVRQQMTEFSSNEMATSVRHHHKLPDLPYKSSALEPIISAEIMELHHQKHHAAYVTNLNNAECQLKEAVEKNDISAIIALQGALKFNGGGHLNHSIFWQNLGPGGGNPSGPILEAICQDFGSFECFKSKMTTMTNAIQGSGWGWLGFNPDSKKLQLATTANQDPLQATTGLVPLLGIDVWEHAYYLQYKNVRAEYTKNIFEVINWEDVCHRHQRACNSCP